MPNDDDNDDDDDDAKSVAVCANVCVRERERMVSNFILQNTEKKYCMRMMIKSNWRNFESNFLYFFHCSAAKTTLVTHFSKDLHV